ncbi:unnamed protein product [Umbelopsis ramanniana]
MRDDAIPYITYASSRPIKSRQITNQNLALIKPDDVWNLFTEDMISAWLKISENPIVFQSDVHLNAPEPLIKPSDGPANQFLNNAIFYVSVATLTVEQVTVCTRAYNVEFPGDFAWPTIMLEHLGGIKDVRNIIHFVYSGAIEKACVLEYNMILRLVYH